MAIIFIRTIIVFVVILFAMRVLGKRQLGELELTELIVAVLISNMASNPLQDVGIPLTNGLIPVFTLLFCELFLSGMILRSSKFRVLVCGKPSMLIVNGEIDQKEMVQCSLTLDELTEELRNQSITDISKVKYAILETDGQLNTILFPNERPVTAGQMNVPTEDTGFPTVIISDGRVMSDNLTLMGKDGNWLKDQLKKRKAKSAGDVFYMTLNDAGQIYYAPKEAKFK